MVSLALVVLLAFKRVPWSVGDQRESHLLPHWGLKSMDGARTPALAPGLQISRSAHGSAGTGDIKGPRQLPATDGGGAARVAEAERTPAALFIDEILSSMPPSMLELVGGILVNVGQERAQLPSDTAAAAGCMLLYGMYADEAVVFVAALTPERSAAFLAALARRVRREASQAAAAGSDYQVTSPFAAPSQGLDRTRSAAQDLAEAGNDIQIGELDPGTIFREATRTLVEARLRLPLGSGAALSYRPSLPAAMSYSGSGPVPHAPQGTSPSAHGAHGAPAHASGASIFSNVPQGGLPQSPSPLKHQHQGATAVQTASSGSTDVLDISTGVGQAVQCLGSSAAVGGATHGASPLGPIRPVPYDLDKGPTPSGLDSNSSLRPRSAVPVHVPIMPGHVPEGCYAAGPMASLDALVSAALNDAEKESDEGVFATARAASIKHAALVESATERLLHLDPEGAAAASFRFIMDTLFTPEACDAGASSTGFIEAWVTYAGGPQYVPIAKYAEACIVYAQALPQEDFLHVTGAYLAAVPGVVAQRLHQHTTSRTGLSRSRGGRGRGVDAFQSLGLTCTDPTCIGCGDDDGPAAAQAVAEASLRAQAADLAERRALVAQQNALLEQREQEQRARQHQLNFDTHRMYSGGSPATSAPTGSGAGGPRGVAMPHAHAPLAPGLTVPMAPAAGGVPGKASAYAHKAPIGAGTAAPPAGGIPAGAGTGGGGVGSGFVMPPPLMPPPLPYTAATSLGMLPPTLPVATPMCTPPSGASGVVSASPGMHASGEADPAFHVSPSSRSGAGPTEPLAAFASIRAGTPVDAVSLKTPILTADKLVRLINVAEDDYDTWFSNYNACVKLLDQGFVQFRQTRVDRATGMDATRDVFRAAFELSDKLSDPFRRVHKQIGTDPNTAERDCLTMLKAINKHAIPRRANAINMDLQKRTFRIGEESITAYLREVTTMAMGHFSESVAREHFMMQVELALDTAQKQDTFDISLINDARDEVIERDSELPGDLEALYDALIGKSNLKAIWTSKSGMPPKKARVNLADPVGPESAPPSPDAAVTAAAAMAQLHCSEATSKLDALVQQLAGLQTSLPAQVAARQLAALSTALPDSLASRQAATASMAQPVGPSTEQSALTSLAAQLQTAIAAFGDASQGAGGQQGGGWQGGGKPWRGGGKPWQGEQGKGKGKPWAPRSPRVLWNMPAIIATGLIWPASTPISWDNAERRGCADGTDDGLFGCKCPFCGSGRTSEMTIEAFRASNGGLGPGSGPNRVPCPPEVSLVHRSLECGIGGRRIERFLYESPQYKDHPAFQAMTPEQLAAFKADGG